MFIVDVMIYIIGIDSKFKNNVEYEKFLNVLLKDIDLDLKLYMGYMLRKYFEIGEYIDFLIYIKVFIIMYLDDLDVMYNYVIVC